MCLMSSAEYGGGSLYSDAIFRQVLRSVFGVSRNLAMLVQFKHPVPKVSTWLAMDKGNIGGATISSKRGWTAGASARDKFSVSLT
jgi:hypothetical protein